MKKLSFLIAIYLFPVIAFANLNFSKDYSFKSFDSEQFKRKIGNILFTNVQRPSKVSLDNRDYELKYTINEKLEAHIKRLLQKYRSDYTSVVVIDNNTGKILTAIDYDRNTNDFGVALTFSSTNPAASIFKVITAAELLENTKTSKETEFSYSGKSSTLYKYQLKNTTSKWTRTEPLKNSFAKSNNVVFGKAALMHANQESLHNMANKFGFNNELMQFIDAGSSKLFIAENDYALAELASGFNTETMISPVHGAVIASVIANDGILKQPTLIEHIKDVKQDRVVWQIQENFKKAISEEAALELREMMELTVQRGTARNAFRPWKTKKLQQLEIGGKTGSITGGIPHGKRDWFVSYARPRNDASDKGVSVCVMIVNVKKWYIKSTYLAKEIIQYYYHDLK
jgi:penicillin-binding protein A